MENWLVIHFSFGFADVRVVKLALMFILRCAESGVCCIKHLSNLCREFWRVYVIIAKKRGAITSDDIILFKRCIYYSKHSSTTLIKVLIIVWPLSILIGEDFSATSGQGSRCLLQDSQIVCFHCALAPSLSGEFIFVGEKIYNYGS